jgi:hypothetical protein
MFVLARNHPGEWTMRLEELVEDSEHTFPLSLPGTFEIPMSTAIHYVLHGLAIEPYHQVDGLAPQSRKDFILSSAAQDHVERQRLYRQLQILLNELARDGLLHLSGLNEDGRRVSVDHHLFGKIGPGRFRHFDEENNELRINIFRELEDLLETPPPDQAHVMFSDLYLRKQDFIDHVIRPNSTLWDAFQRDNGYVRRKGRPRMSDAKETRGRKAAYDVVPFLETAKELLKRDVAYPSWSAFYRELRGHEEDGGPDDHWFNRNLKSKITATMPEIVYSLIPRKRSRFARK